MLLPTQDKEALLEIATYIYANFHTWKEPTYSDLSTVNQQGWLQYAEDITEKLEKLGYHKGLPTSIEEAL